jgi:hypothetical protein
VLSARKFITQSGPTDADGYLEPRQWKQLSLLTAALPKFEQQEASRKLEEATSEWTVSENRVYDEDPPEPTPYDAIQSSLDTLEENLAQVRSVSSAIGGNKPPEEIGVGARDGICCEATISHEYLRSRNYGRIGLLVITRARVKLLGL